MDWKLGNRENMKKQGNFCENQFYRNNLTDQKITKSKAQKFPISLDNTLADPFKGFRYLKVNLNN